MLLDTKTHNIFSFISSDLCFLAAGDTTMAQGHKFQDLEETGEALVAFINSSQPENLRRDEHQALFDQHVETKKIVTQILKGEYSL